MILIIHNYKKHARLQRDGVGFLHHRRETARFGGADEGGFARLEVGEPALEVCVRHVRGWG